jgi:hypothetical protein
MNNLGNDIADGTKHAVGTQKKSVLRHVYHASMSFP